MSKIILGAMQTKSWYKSDRAIQTVQNNMITFSESSDSMAPVLYDPFTESFHHHGQERIALDDLTLLPVVTNTWLAKDSFLV